MCRPPSRRSLLRASLTSGLALFAGCSGDNPARTATTDSRTTSREIETPAETEPPQRRTDDPSSKMECSPTGHPGGSAGQWPMPAHDVASTRYNPAGEGPTSTISTRWRLDPPEDTGFTATGPIVVDGTVFVARGGADTSHDPERAPWYLLALDAEDGSEVWRFESGGIVRSPPVYDGQRVYVVADEAVTAVDAEEGTRRWSFRVATNPGRRVAPVGDRVYLGSGDGVFALDATDGTEGWRAEVADAYEFAVSDGTLYATSDHGAQLVAIDAADGSVQWRVRARHDGFDSPTVLDCTIFVGDGEYVRALDARDGTEQWTFQTYGGRVHGQAVDGERVYAAVGSSVFGLDADDGTQRWHSGAERQSTPPSVVGETLYVGDIAGLVRALDAGSGAERWRHETVQGVFDDPAVAEGVVYACDRDGIVYALKSADG